MAAPATEGPPGELLTSLVFPVYNPGALIQQTWGEVDGFLRRAPGSWEILFVCDGCTDGTPERLTSLERIKSRGVRVLGYPKNRGKGYAVRLGLQEARGAWRLFTDVDLAYSLEDVLRLARTLWQGAEVAIASRTHPQSRVVAPTRLLGYAWRRYLQSQVFGSLARWLLPLDQRDTQAGLKGMTARVASLLLPHLTCEGFGFDCELLTACRRFHLPVTEVPVEVRLEDKVSTTDWRTMVRMVGELRHIRQGWYKKPPVMALPVHPTRREAA